MTRKQFESPQLNTIEGLTAKLMEVNAQLSEAKASQKRVFDNISHDLRAPLTAIRSAVDLLLTYENDEELNPEDVWQLVHLVDTRMKSLETMVNDLYYLTTLDNTNHPFIYEEVPIRDFVEEYFFMTEVDSRFKTHHLFLDTDEVSDELVRLDVDHMTRVLDNLMTNARKYSEPGSNITIGVRKCLDDTSMLELFVKDNGIGIPADRVDKVFDRMYMVCDARTPSETTGSGLGLSIVKDIIEKHQGVVYCISEIGKGSTFVCRLPITK